MPENCFNKSSIEQFKPEIISYIFIGYMEFRRYIKTNRQAYTI
ncbi:MAG: hypothetical protein PWQ63_797 [Methanolobus sp.]|nr:hypothetical protein [Methanolobus sp.]